MSAETLQQRCTVCGESFTVAKPAQLPVIPTKCPSCAQSGRMTEAEAIAAAMAAGARFEKESQADKVFYAKRVGIGLFALAVFGLVLLMGRFQLSRGEFNVLPGMFVLALLAGGGAVLWYWGYRQTERE